MLHTSGTTGNPKRVPFTHANLTISVYNIIDTFRLTPEDVSLCVMPLFHIHGLVASTLAALGAGGTVVLPTRFSALNFWPIVEEFGVTWISAVPAIHLAVINRAKSRGDRPFKDRVYQGLRFIRTCSASLQPSTLDEIEEYFGVPVLESYGMTEAAHQIAANPLPPAGMRLPGSVGRGTGVSIGIIDQQGGLQPSGVKGKVVIKGPTVTKGYENNPEANAAAFTDGWFRTGDEGIIDEEGDLTLVGRLEDLINYNGMKVSSKEIEDVLTTHASVAEAIAFGVPHPIHGEVPSAAVVLRSPAMQTELSALCRKLLSSFKCPKSNHIVPEIPRTATGKALRRQVAAEFANASG